MFRCRRKVRKSTNSRHRQVSRYMHRCTSKLSATKTRVLGAFEQQVESKRLSCLGFVGLQLRPNAIPLAIGKIERSRRSVSAKPNVDGICQTQLSFEGGETSQLTCKECDELRYQPLRLCCIRHHQCADKQCLGQVQRCPHTSSRQALCTKHQSRHSHIVAEI